MALIRIIIFMVAALALWPASLLADDLPPGPTAIHPLGRMSVEHDPGQFEETQSIILDFAPGAWTPLHSHGGLTLVRVLEGEMTRRINGTEDLFTAGEGWVEMPGDIHEAGNAGGTPARVMVTFLMPTGAPLTTVAGSPSQGAPPGPTTAFQSRRVAVTTAAGSFDEVATTMLGFASGAWTPLHSHSGLTLVAVVDGEMTVRSGGRETVYRAGDVWIEQPGDVHVAGNATATDARVVVTFLLRHGAPVTIAAATQAPTPMPSALPRTGEASGLPAFATAATLLGAGIYLRRRISQSQA